MRPQTKRSRVPLGPGLPRGPLAHSPRPRRTRQPEWYIDTCTGDAGSDREGRDSRYRRTGSVYPKKWVCRSYGEGCQSLAHPGPLGPLRPETLAPRTPPPHRGGSPGRPPQSGPVRSSGWGRPTLKVVDSEEGRYREVSPTGTSLSWCPLGSVRPWFSSGTLSVKDLDPWWGPSPSASDPDPVRRSRCPV